jgi:hypothetical protein
MSIYLGTAEIDSLKLGTADVSRVMLGNAEVWSAFDPDAADYFARIVSAGSSISVDNKAAVDAFVRGCKADGIWTAIKASCLLAGPDDLTGALVPLVGPAPTNNGPFVSGDYNRTTGLVGNGSTKYIDSNYAMSSMPQNSNHAAAGVTSPHTTIGVAGAHWGAGVSGSETVVNCARTGANVNDFFSRQMNITGSTVASRGQHTGLVAHSRASSAQWKIRSNGTESTISQTSAAPNSRTLFIAAQNSGSATLYSVGRYHYYSFGESLDLALLDARLATYMSALT